VAARKSVRSSVFPLALALGFATLSYAQTTSAPQTSDCTATFLSQCKDNTTPLQGLSSEPTTSQRPQNSGGTTYVDSAGRGQSQQQNNERLNQVFPPDPITDLQRLTRSSTGDLIPIFGRDFFKQVPSTFAPGDQLGVTPDYVIGPGDDVLLRMWGPESFNSQLTVDRSGSIYVPNVGSIHVAGLHFDELQKQITTELSRTYRNFNISVNLGRLRSIQIYVVGEARKPGAYTISALSTVLNALFVSGGPNVQGSLRHIQVRRAGQSISEFDLYDLVLRGDKSKDVRLEQGDTIFIPPVGPQAALAGSVRHPAIYELASESTLNDVLKIAGGFSATASQTQISLERIEADGVRRVVNVALDSAGRGMTLRDGDVIFVGHITAAYQQSVTIRGNLANPGRFAWHQGMRLSDILPDRSSLLTTNYWRERTRLGVPVPLFQPIGNANSTAGLAGGQEQSTSATSVGLASGETLPQTSQTDDMPPSQTDAMQGGLQKDQPADQSTSGTIADQQRQTQQSTVDAQSAPKNRISIPAPEIDWSYAVIERLNPDTLKSSLVPFNLGKLVQDHDPSQDLELRPGDVVTILSQNDISVPQDLRTKYVRLEGEFVSAGVYSVLPGETLDHLVQRAGGLTANAYLYGSSFNRESARVFQQQRLDEYIAKLSVDMERSSAVRSASSTSGILDPTSLADQRNIIAQLRQIRATGRIVLEFAPDSVGINPIPKIPLENDDVFRVPSTPNTVSVIGAVYGQNVFLYNSKRKLEDYISLAGKPNRIADPQHAFVIRADGSIFSRDLAKRAFSNASIYPGDAIVVPEKLIKPSGIKNLIDFSQILSSFGIAAAGINVLR
jgi:protein involved in polysaccharide export with SLBB domain